MSVRGTARGITKACQIESCARLKTARPLLLRDGDSSGRRGALTRVEEALALAGEIGEHWSDAFLHRLRGEILLKRDPANTAPAEDALLAGFAQKPRPHARPKPRAR